VKRGTISSLFYKRFNENKPYTYEFEVFTVVEFQVEFCCVVISCIHNPEEYDLKLYTVE
jgi:hypothetical protein